MRSIRTKLAALVISTVCLSVLIAATMLAWIDASNRFDERERELHGIAAVIASAISKPIADGDVTHASRTLGSIGRIPGISYARVVDPAGVLLWQHGFGIVVERVSGDVATNVDLNPLSALHLATYPVTAPIIFGGRQVGEIMLIADLSDLNSATYASIRSGLAAAFIAMALGLALAWPLQRAITAPISRLTAAMVAVGSTKDFSGQVEVTSNDETGLLVGTFNGMLNEIRTRDAELTRHRDHLEAEVAERTVELRHAKQVAEVANAAKSDFLATMSHEIRTPLNGMLVTSELIATSALSPKVKRHADVLVTAGRTLLAIINDILDLSKIEAGKLELEAISVAPRRLADDVVALFAPRAAEQGVALTATVAEDIPNFVTGDPVRLGQILSNLVSNALKFTKSGSVAISIAAEPSAADHGRELRLDVRDTGIGIPADKLEAIFEAFSQADQSTTRSFGGTGIGLTICRRLVSAMNGTITVASEPGLGSTFTVRLPLVESAAVDELESSEPAADSHGTLAGLSVLAADDNAVNREVIAEALDRLGVKAQCVADGREAVEAVATGRFDVVLMDCNMPVMDGYEAAREIRSQESQEQRAPIPIIALTAYAIGEHASKWRDAGMSSYLTKPYTLTALRKALAAATAHVARPSHNDAAASSPSAPPAEVTPTDIPLLADDTLAALREMQLPGDDLVGRLARLYAAHAPARLTEIDAAIVAGAPEALARAAHALRSMSSNIGARRVAELCAELEATAATATNDRQRALACEISAAVPASLAALAQAAFATTAAPAPATSTAA